MLKVIYAQVDREAALKKAGTVEEKLRRMKHPKAADKVRDEILETLTYMSFPEEHWLRIRTNNTLERINREIKRCTKVVGTFPDGDSALMLVCVRLRHIVSNSWCQTAKRFIPQLNLRNIIDSTLTNPVGCRGTHGLPYSLNPTYFGKNLLVVYYIIISEKKRDEMTCISPRSSSKATN